MSKEFVGWAGIAAWVFLQFLLFLVSLIAGLS